MPQWRAALRLAVPTLLTAATMLALALWHFQERLIYPAPKYATRDFATLPGGLTALRDPMDSESVVGFYRAPVDGELDHLWLVFGGNGDVALAWDALLAPAATHGVGILMVEYPGYGARRGEPSPESLLAGAEDSVAALSQRLGIGADPREHRTSVLGYSIGSAVALAYAARHPVGRIILVAPFTSMRDMARATVGAPLHLLLRHHYDSRESLRAIRARPVVPPVSILHGEADRLIPSRMGEELAGLVPGSHFELVPGAGHGDVISLGRSRLLTLLAE